jgi:hypothetical protein
MNFGRSRAQYIHIICSLSEKRRFDQDFYLIFAFL